MPVNTQYDAGIVGGGLAGLALSIQLARQGHRVILFEKEQYPFHKVCGEYISLESWDFLTGLGVDLKSMNVPIITQLQVSAVNGKLLQQKLLVAAGVGNEMGYNADFIFQIGSNHGFEGDFHKTMDCPN